MRRRPCRPMLSLNIPMFVGMLLLLSGLGEISAWAETAASLPWAQEILSTLQADRRRSSAEERRQAWEGRVARLKRPKSRATRPRAPKVATAAPRGRLALSLVFASSQRRWR